MKDRKFRVQSSLFRSLWLDPPLLPQSKKAKKKPARRPLPKKTELLGLLELKPFIPELVVEV
jgi:hypothetical protein